MSRLTAFFMKAIAFLSWPCDYNVWVIMLVSMSGCLSLRTLFLVSEIWICSCSASFHCPWFPYVDARFFMLISVDGCSSQAPSSLSPWLEPPAALPHPNIQLQRILFHNLCITRHCKPLESPARHCIDWWLSYEEQVFDRMHNLRKWRQD